MYQRIKELRIRAGISQKQAAALIKVTQATYSRYESGVLDLPTDALIKLAKFYGTSVDYLLGLTTESTPYDRMND